MIASCIMLSQLGADPELLIQFLNCEDSRTRRVLLEKVLHTFPAHNLQKAEPYFKKIEEAISV